MTLYEQLRPIQRHLLFGLCVGVVVASLVLGGGTRNGFLSDVLLQLFAIPLAMAVLWRMFKSPDGEFGYPGVAICFAICLVPLVQLIPMPSWIWTNLPGRGPSAETFHLLGRDLPWMPLSVSGRATWLSVLSLIPPVAIFLGISSLGYRQRRAISLIIIGVGVISVFVGLIQIAQGPTSSLRFFAFTNTSEAVGFFANRNHFAALLYTLMLFSAAWAVNTAKSAGPKILDKRFETAPVLALAASFTVLIVLVAAQAMARSRAGLGLTILALMGAYALSLSDRRNASGISMAKLILGSVAVAAVFSSQFAIYRIMQRLSSDPLGDARIVFAGNTIEAIKAYFPFGSGMGTFISVYGIFEKPVDLLANTYANRAHNDILELLLETGVIGLFVMLAFAIWLGMRTFVVWRRSTLTGRAIDHLLARAATIVIPLIVAHSLVDYPLRTGAMMVIFAFACALLIDPPMEAGGEEVDVSSQDTLEEPARRAVETPEAAAPFKPFVQPSPSQIQVGVTAPPQPQQTSEPWGKDIEWPDEWRKPARQDPADGSK